MNDFDLRQRQRLLNLVSRRELFSRLGMGASAMALASLLQGEAQANEVEGPKRYDLLPRAPHFAPKVRRVIYLFQNGGPSHVDMFDPKPLLKKHDGEKPGVGFVND